MLKMSNDKVISSYIEGFKPPDFFFALFPSLNPGGWNVPVLLQYLTGLNVQRMHSRKNRPKEDTQPIKRRLGDVEPKSLAQCSFL